jgi:hypothetical protein
MAPREALQATVRVGAAELVKVPDDGQRQRTRWYRTNAVLAACARASNDDGKARNHEDETEED